MGTFCGEVRFGVAVRVADRAIQRIAGRLGRECKPRVARLVDVRRAEALAPRTAHADLRNRRPLRRELGRPLAAVGVVIVPADGSAKLQALQHRSVDFRVERGVGLVADGVEAVEAGHRSVFTLRRIVGVELLVVRSSRPAQARAGRRRASSESLVAVNWMKLYSFVILVDDGRRSVGIDHVGRIAAVQDERVDGLLSAARSAL